MTNINNEYADAKLYQLRRCRGGAGAPRRGGGAGGGGAGASGGPNQRRYSFIMNGFKK